MKMTTKTKKPTERNIDLARELRNEAENWVNRTFNFIQLEAFEALNRSGKKSLPGKALLITKVTMVTRNGSRNNKKNIQILKITLPTTC
jgi:hypothetical protein